MKEGVEDMGNLGKLGINIVIAVVPVVVKFILEKYKR